MVSLFGRDEVGWRFIRVDLAFMNDNGLEVGSGALGYFDLGVPVRFTKDFDALCWDVCSCYSFRTISRQFKRVILQNGCSSTTLYSLLGGGAMNRGIVAVCVCS